MLDLLTWLHWLERSLLLGAHVGEALGVEQVYALAGVLTSMFVLLVHTTFSATEEFRKGSPASNLLYLFIGCTAWLADLSSPTRAYHSELAES